MTLLIGDAYPLPRPADVYDFDQCDEMTLAVLATLDEVRRRIIARERGYPSGKALCRLVDDYAREIIANHSGDEEDEDT